VNTVVSVRTLLRAAGVEAAAWLRDERGLSSAFAHAEAWTGRLAATEAWLLHGLSLKPRRGGA